MSPGISGRFGARVRRLRGRLAISQEELAARAGLHRTYVAAIEARGRNVTLKSIEKLAAALQVSSAALLAPTPEPGADSPAAPAPALPDERFVDLLLVEDNPDDVELTLCAFRRTRLANRIQVVRDGAAALDYLFCRGPYAGRSRRGRPRLVLLDLYLPKVSGLEVLRRVRADPRTRPVPVVILTASHAARDLALCQRLGATSYIVKPVDFQALSAVTPGLSLDWGLMKGAWSLPGGHSAAPPSPATT